MGFSSPAAVTCAALLLTAFNSAAQGGVTPQDNPAPTVRPPEEVKSRDDPVTGENNASSVFAGTIEAAMVRGSYRESYTYTVGSNMLRVVRNETDYPYPTNLVELDTGHITLVFPHNRSFMRFKAPAGAAAGPSGFPDMPMPPGGLPEGIGPQAGFSGIPEASMPSGMSGMNNMMMGTGNELTPPPGTGPQPNSATPFNPSASAVPPAYSGSTNQPGESGMPSGFREGMVMPPGGLPEGIGPQAGSQSMSDDALPAGMPGMMPRPDGARSGRMPEERTRPSRRRFSREIQFSKTGETTNLLGYACTRYEVRQHDRVMVIWATDQLLPFYPWLQDPPPHHHGPPILEERWGELLHERRLFPLNVEVRTNEGNTLPFEFKVLSVTPMHFGKVEEKLFKPPPDYHELELPPF